MQVDKSTANVLGTNKQKNMYTYIFSLCCEYVCSHHALGYVNRKYIITW